MASTSYGVQNKNITGYLKRIIGNPVGQLHPLVDTPIIIGRSNQCQICIHDPNISRNHCTLNYAVAGWSITDLGGINGTFLNGHRLVPKQPYRLTDRINISLGPPQDAPYAFQFQKNEVIPEANRQDEMRRTSNINEQITCKLKRKSELGTMTFNGTRRKRLTPSHTDIEIDVESSQDPDVANCSFTSISSMDSLSTRIRKQHGSEKRRKKLVRKKRNLPYPLPGATDKMEIVMSDELDKMLHKKCEDGDNSKSLLEDSQLEPSASQSKTSYPDGLVKNLQCIITDLQEKLHKTEKYLKKATTESKSLSDKLKELKNRGTTVAITKNELKKVLEEELNCNICFNVVIKATTLGCSHTFCNHCIMEWKSKKKECPNCRERIVSMSRVLVMDNLIERAITQMDTEYQESRQSTIKEIEHGMANKAKRPKKRRKRRSVMSNRRSPRVTLQNIPLDTISSNIQQPYEVAVLYSDSEMSSINIGFSEDNPEDTSLEGNEDYDVYVHCFLCGRRGHWASNCTEI